MQSKGCENHRGENGIFSRTNPASGGGYGCWVGSGSSFNIGVGVFRGNMTDILTPTRPAHLWKKGQSGNPTGRKKGTRNALSELFVDDLYFDWTQFGMQAIVKVREESPANYLKIVASLVPKDINLVGAQGEQWLEALENFNQIAKAHRAKLIEQKAEDENG